MITIVTLAKSQRTEQRAEVPPIVDFVWEMIGRKKGDHSLLFIMKIFHDILK